MVVANAEFAQSYSFQLLRTLLRSPFISHPRDDGACYLQVSPEKLTRERTMGISFFALPSKQGPVQGRFKPTHRPISLSTKVAACVRRFETPTPLNHGRPALALSSRSVVWIREYFTSQLSLPMPCEPGLGQGQSQKKTSPWPYENFFNQ